MFIVDWYSAAVLLLLYAGDPEEKEENIEVLRGIGSIYRDGSILYLFDSGAVRKPLISL